jgi:hypothetical protein
MNSNNMSNSKYNKRARSSSPDDYREQSSDILMFEKENEPERNIDLEIEQINTVRYFFFCGQIFH